MDKFTYGELISIELVLAEKIKEMDLSMRAGQFFVSIIGKVEHQLGAIEAGQSQTAIPFENPDNSPKK